MDQKEKLGYAPEQMKGAERLAEALKDTPKESIIVMLGSAFISGLQAGMQIPINQEAGIALEREEMGKVAV